MNHTPLLGLIAAPFTAFQNDGSVNLTAIEKQAQSLVANRVSGAFVCGTTGEGLSLSVAERVQVAERWRVVAGRNLQLIVHIGANSVEDCRVLAQHAQKIAADAISAFAPSFFKPGAIDDLVNFVAAVAGAAPATPFYYYHIPSMSGVNLDMANFLAAASNRIPNLVGIKFTHENLMEFLACARLENGRFDMVYGRDEALLAGLATGARAAIGSTYNLAAPIYNRLIAAFKKGDLATAQDEQYRGVQLIRLLVSYGFLPAAKATTSMLGVDLGPMRTPLRTLNADQVKKLRADLERLGFFDWLK
jgi:N-acetylneuraminate lyase